ncbi:SNARE associated Golgi protein [uncultured archaeon]|nr:SNARE associated Golgi protein [uncultured archaeon]
MAKRKKAPAREPKPARAEARPPRKSAARQEFRFGLFQIAAMFLLSLAIWQAAPLLAPLREWSYPGAFLLAFLASATVFVPAGPLQFFVAAMARQSALNPLLLGLFAGIGSGIGELSGFFIGQGSQHVLRTRDKALKWLLALQTGLLRRWAGLGVFVLAAVPNPFFDFAGIAAGLMGMSWWEFLLWCIAGRIVRFIALSYLGIWSAHYF